MSFLKKLGLGLKKSSSKITNGIGDIFTKKKVDEQTLEELEELLIASDLGVQTSFKIIDEFRKKRLNKEAGIEEIKLELAEDIETILKPCELPIMAQWSEGDFRGADGSSFLSAAPECTNSYMRMRASKKNDQMPYKITLPTIILMVGVNGAGKTTTIGKLASKYKAQNLKTSLIAGDTFRAAAVEQLKAWGERSNTRVFSGAPNCDPAGLIYDGLQEAVKQQDDVVFIDTAGRLQNKSQLMEELKKIIRVIKKIIPEAPHHTLLCLDATTGQNAFDQVKIFKEMVDISGLIITKLDGTSKGGILVSIADHYQTPIHYIGIGEGIEDLDEFSAHDFAKNLVGL